MGKPVQIKVLGFNDVMQELIDKQDALQKKLSVMTPEERAEWDKAEAKRQEETEEILKQLRGPGFFEGKL